uniref:Uncharacterized protein n=1 Tax=Physcomitrium patens TaxID=3218 RepID=A0A2K1L834_PHYPA|nr:hypothetical protein PHYPA_000611 [Physcomitrium patens]
MLVAAQTCIKVASNYLLCYHCNSSTILSKYNLHHLHLTICSLILHALISIYTAH